MSYISFPKNVAIGAGFGVYPPADDPVTRALVSIAVTPDDIELAAGLTQQYTAVGTYDDGSKLDITEHCLWDTSDHDVALFEADSAAGLVTTFIEGECDITATVGLIVGQTGLTVTAAVLASIAVTPLDIETPIGYDTQYTAEGVYTDLTTINITSDVTWSSNDETVATISNEDGYQGVASPVGVGHCTIFATLDEIEGSTGLTIDPPIVTGLDVLPNKPLIPIGLTQQFTATLYYSDGSTVDVTEDSDWSSDDPTIVTISNETGTKGLATAVSEDSAAIQIIYGDMDPGSIPVEVVAPVIVSIEVTPSEITVAVDDTYQLTAMATLSNGLIEDVTASAVWASDDTDVASCPDLTPGIVYGVAEGNAGVTAEAESVTSNTVAVTVIPV